MFEYSGTELATIDQQLTPKLDWAKTRYAEAHQLALDSTRLLSCTSDRLEAYRSKGFFKRVWYKLSGKTGDIQRANQADLLEAQKVGWRYLELLNERDLLQAQSIIAVRNNLLTLAAKEEQTRKEVARLAERVYERFIKLEQRVEMLEVGQQMHAWLLTMETNDYDEKYPPHLRMLRVVNDFVRLKPESWNMMELKYLQSGLMKAGIDWKRELSLEEFVTELIDEIESKSFPIFEGLVLERGDAQPPASFVLENVAVPSYAALFEIANSFTISSATIEVLREHLRIGRAEAIRQVLKSFMAGQGIDLGARTQLRWLAIELLDSMQLARSLFLEGAEGTSEPDDAEATPAASAPELPKDDVATLVARLHPSVRQIAAALFASPKVTFIWTDGFETKLIISREGDSSWAAHVENEHSAASYRVRLAPDPGTLYGLDEPTVTGALFGSRHDLSQLEGIKLGPATGHAAAQEGKQFVEAKLSYRGARIVTVYPTVRWRMPMGVQPSAEARKEPARGDECPHCGSFEVCRYPEYSVCFKCGRSFQP